MTEVYLLCDVAGRPIVDNTCLYRAYASREAIERKIKKEQDSYRRSRAYYQKRVDEGLCCQIPCWLSAPPSFTIKEVFSE